ncbi:MAG: methionyl-tRNA formyltransferase [Planctomycetes bacterium]|nr:methionyl-tRNA formyltransferase [Planctomycetota bacterium]
MKVVFFGTSKFAVPALEALAKDERFTVVAVVTQPDSRAGRGLEVLPSTVRAAAEALGVAVLQPPDINAPDMLQQLKAMKPDLLLTAAYGQKLSDELLKLPKKFALNLHGSLLPRHRGASPIQAAILTGDTESGVTLMGMTSRMDAGPIFAKRATPIGKDETAGELHDRLAVIARDLLMECADALLAGKLKGVEQDPKLATKAALLDKDDGRVRWDRTALEIHRHVRGMTPWPGAFTFAPTDRSVTRLIVVKGEVVDVPSPAMPGTVVAFTNGIEVATKRGIYSVREVKRSGKRSLKAAEFMRGFPLPVGTRLN